MSTKCRSKEVIGGMIEDEEVLQSDRSSFSSSKSDPDSGPQEASFFTGVKSIRKAPKMAPKRVDHEASTSLVHSLNSLKIQIGSRDSTKIETYLVVSR